MNDPEPDPPEQDCPEPADIFRPKVEDLLRD
jgi:hypothetical protein